MKKLILASTSPRRNEILTLSGLRFETEAPLCDETVQLSSPEDYVLELSRRKACAVAHKEPDAYVIGADTIVYANGRILGKPADPKEALNMLKQLQGTNHFVYTGVTVENTQEHKIVSFCEKTEVEFYDFTDEELMAYVDTKEPMDKAGAYGIQGRGAFLVKRINGDYYNVVGLPFARLMKVLKESGYYE